MQSSKSRIAALSLSVLFVLSSCFVYTAAAVHSLLCTGSVQPTLVTLPLPPLAESSSQQGSVSCLPFLHLPDVEAGPDPLRSAEEKV
ncbi:unnamed protein product, partial [Ectocarpus sp. 13 AM-2016]